MFDVYDKRYFAELAGGALKPALRILPLVLDLIEPESVIDVGCAAGDWLNAVTRISDCEILGLDGAYVPADLLAIPRERFIPTDLRDSLTVGRRFDLAISLEVAEHLPENRADGFVHDLTQLAPAVLFSAAGPGQGGDGHVNVQWQSYWIDLFVKYGYEAWDVIRPAVWDDQEFPYCYQQNMFLFVDPKVHGHRPELAPTIADAVHPELFRLALNLHSSPTLREVLTQLPRASRDSLTYHLSHLQAKLRR
jgi:hypothetical protein